MGKLTAAAISAIIVVGIIAISSWRDETVHLVSLALVALIVLACFWFIRQIVNEHPELATLEGKDVVDFTQLQIAAKHHPALPDASVSGDPEPPLIEVPREEDE